MVELGDLNVSLGESLIEESLVMLTAYDRNADVSICVWKRERNGISTVSNNTYHLQNEREMNINEVSAFA